MQKVLGDQEGFTGRRPSTSQDEGLAEVVRLEQQLLDPAVRGSDEVIERILHPDFIEFGASGRVWEYATIKVLLRENPAVSGQAVDFVPVQLSDHVVLLTYRIDGESDSLRSSIWIRDLEVGWRIRFHQGTRSTSKRL